MAYSRTKSFLTYFAFEQWRFDGIMNGTTYQRNGFGPNGPCSFRRRDESGVTIAKFNDPPYSSRICHLRILGSLKPPAFCCRDPLLPIRKAGGLLPETSREPSRQTYLLRRDSCGEPRKGERAMQPRPRVFPKRADSRGHRREMHGSASRKVAATAVLRSGRVTVFPSFVHASPRQPSSGARVSACARLHSQPTVFKPLANAR